MPSPVTKYTSPLHSSLRGSDFRALRHRIKSNGRDKYSARAFAADLKISESLLELVEIGRREITPSLARAYKRVERALLFCLREDEQVDAETAEWLVDALQRHAASLRPRDRKRLKKIVAAL